MPNYNSVVLVGRMAEDARVYAENGKTPSATMIVVINGSYKDASKQLVQTTDSFMIKMYGEPAQYASLYLGKGSLVKVSGKLRTEKWKDKTTGEQHYKVVVVIDKQHQLQGLANPGHQVEGGENEDEGTQAAAHGESNPVDVSKPVESSGPAADSTEFERQHGIQPIPF